MRALAATCSAGFALSSVAIAAPADRGRGVEWTAPEVCPDAREVERRIAGYVAVPAGFAPRRVDVVADAEGFAATLVEDGAEPRVLRAPSCDTLADAVAVVVALAVEAAVAENPVPIVEPEPPPTEPATQDEPAPTEIVDARETDASRTTSIGTARSSNATAPSRARIGVDARAALGYTSMVAPRGGAWLMAGASVGGRYWSIEADGRLFLPRNFEAATFDYGARVTGGAAHVAGCGRPGVGRVSFPICAGVEAGQLRVDPRGVPGGRRTTYPWLATMLAAALHVRVLPRLAIVVGGELVVPMLRARLAIVDAPPLFETPVVGGRASVGLEVALRRRR